MQITMVGTGYVGLVTGTCLANTGNDVTCLDIDQDKIDSLRQGSIPLYEPELEELIHRNVKAGRLHFTADKQEAYRPAQIIFICVGTPGDEQGRPDLTYVYAAARDIGVAIEDGPGPTGGGADDHDPKIVVVKSTVPVGTGAEIHARISEQTSKPFMVASNPEFLKEGAAISDFNKPDRVVIGVEQQRVAEMLSDLYEPFVRQGHSILVMDIRSAEMVKYAANAMLATKISFINEIANLCEAYGADVGQVRRGMCADQRIGNQFLYPGLGYGGSCFPKDVQAVVEMGNRRQIPMLLLSAVHEVNGLQRRSFVSKIDRHYGIEEGIEEGIGEGIGDGVGDGVREGVTDAVAVGVKAGSSEGTPTAGRPVSASETGDSSLAGRRFAVWGIAFKPGTDDVREAPSITIMEHLLQHGAAVTAHDPVALTTCRGVLGDRVTYADDLMGALDGADALIVCTDWGEFKNPDFQQMKRRMKSPVIFDGRNLYRRSIMKEQGFIYYCVGREPVIPAQMAEDSRR